VSEHPADCPGADHKNARSHFVCRAFDGRRFQPLAEDSKFKTETILTSRSGRKVALNASARAALRSNGCDDDIKSPTITRCSKPQKFKGL